MSVLISNKPGCALAGFCAAFRHCKETPSSSLPTVWHTGIEKPGDARVKVEQELGHNFPKLLTFY